MATLEVFHKMDDRRIIIRETSSGDFEWAVSHFELEEITSYLNEIHVPYRILRGSEKAEFAKNHVALLFPKPIRETVLREVMEHFYDGIGLVEVRNVEP